MMDFGGLAGVFVFTRRRVVPRFELATEIRVRMKIEDSDYTKIRHFFQSFKI